ncbi:hypothetical protein ACRAWD_06560 [Caulobacter segnis]
MLRRGLTLALLVAGASQLALYGRAFAQQSGGGGDATVEEIVVHGVRDPRSSRWTSSAARPPSSAPSRRKTSASCGRHHRRLAAAHLGHPDPTRRRRGHETPPTSAARQVITLLNGFEQYPRRRQHGRGPAEPAGRAVSADEPGAGLQVRPIPRTRSRASRAPLDLRTRRPFQFGKAYSYRRGQGWRRPPEDMSAERRRQLAQRPRRPDGRHTSGPTSATTIQARSMLSRATTTGAASPPATSAPHGYESFSRVVRRKRLRQRGVRGRPGRGFTDAEVPPKLDEYNRAVGINISNRWDGGAFGVWNKPTVSTPVGIGNWLAVGEWRHRSRWWAENHFVFTVFRATESRPRTTIFRTGLRQWRSVHLRGPGHRADGDRLSMNGQAQGDLSNWRYADGRFNLFRDPADRTRGTFYPKAICDKFGSSRRTNAITGSAGGCYIDPNPLGYGANPQLHYNISGDHPVWSGFDRPLAGGLGAGKSLKDYMANKDSYAIGASRRKATTRSTRT